MSDITLRQIRYFLVLSTALQYQRAARQLGISQPSLSQQINALETTIGTRLIERRRRGLILTPAGRDAAAKAAGILRDVEGLTHLAQPTDTGLHGTLRLGSSPTIGPYLLPRVLRHLHASYPDMKLVIRDGPPRELSEDLVAGRHDMILTQLPIPGDDIRVQTLFREPLVLALATDHPLAHRRRVRAADLAGANILSLSPAYALHRQVAELAQRSQAVLRDDFEGTSLDALRQMVSLGMGLTLLPALYAQSEVKPSDADVATVSTQPALHRQIGLAWRATSGQPLVFSKFGDLIRQVVSDEFAALVTLST